MNLETRIPEVQSDNRFLALADAIASAVLIFQGKECKYANRAAQRITGYTAEELMARNSWDFVHADSLSEVTAQNRVLERSETMTVRYELKVLNKDGQARWLDATVARIDLDGNPAELLTALDITERKINGAADSETSARDPLTGLLTFAQVQRVFLTEARRSERTGRSFGLLLLKIDKLEHIHQRYGFPAGSRALCKLSYVVGAVCRSGDIAARYDEDSFVLLLPETPADGVRQLTGRITERLYNEPNDPPFTVSAGTAVFPQNGPTIEHLVRAASRGIQNIAAPPAKKLTRSA